MFTKKEALEIVGGLARTKKMPGQSWSISAQLCNVGSKLRQVPGSTCSKCYALKGNYTRFHSVQDAMAHRLDAFRNNPDWDEAMVHLISTHKVPYFRWFDSGDLQHWEMLLRIMAVARQTRTVSHWLPTRETALLKELNKRKTISIPENLIIRRSNTMIGELPPEGGNWREDLQYSSGVMPKKYANIWPELVRGNTSYLFRCPAPLQEGECGDCRACWDPMVLHVDYLEH